MIVTSVQAKTYWREGSPNAPHNTAWWSCSPMGWLHAIGHKPTSAEYARYTYDEDVKQWRETSSLGNYLDYGPDHHRSPHQYCSDGNCRCRESEPGNVHCVYYGSTTERPCGDSQRTARYVGNIADAKEWIEDQARRYRPELFA